MCVYVGQNKTPPIHNIAIQIQAYQKLVNKPNQQSKKWPINIVWNKTSTHQIKK